MSYFPTAFFNSFITWSVWWDFSKPRKNFVFFCTSFIHLAFDLILSEDLSFSHFKKLIFLCFQSFLFLVEKQIENYFTFLNYCTWLLNDSHFDRGDTSITRFSIIRLFFIAKWTWVLCPIVASLFPIIRIQRKFWNSMICHSGIIWMRVWNTESYDFICIINETFVISKHLYVKSYKKLLNVIEHLKVKVMWPDLHPN